MKLEPFSKTYDGTTVLSFPGLTLEPGRIYAVIGANGSGKSTFARVVAGVLPADGKFRFPHRVGYLPQKPYAFRLSVKRNILLCGDSPARADALMQALGLELLADKRADRLSGGETARMALARLMMNAYQVVLLDEPTAAMDMETTAAAEELMLSYTRQTGCALILVTHSLQQARRVADQVLFFHKGRLAESGPRDQVLQHPACPETRQFLDFYGR